MTLTQEHIQQLYAFTQKHYVDWYDVQTELVDHLAKGIETQWTKHPERSFEEALNHEFSKFGVCGFSDVISEKTKALNQQYWHIIWQYFKTFFKVPKLVLTLGMIWSYYHLLLWSMQINIYLVLIPTLTLIFGTPWYVLIKNAMRSKKQVSQTGKKWLFDSVISQLGGLGHLLNVAIYFQLIYQSTKVWSPLVALLFSAVVIVVAVLFYTAIFVVTPKLRVSMAKQHPEYKLA